MERIDAMLLIKDVAYRSAFIRAVSMEWSGFTFIIPDFRSDLKKYDAKLVISDEFNDTLLHHILSEYASSGIKTVYMTESADKESIFEEPYIIYKYDSVLSIVSKLKYIIGKGPLVNSKMKKCFSVSVITDEGGIGTTTFSLALAGMLNMAETKSLYISLSPVNTCRNYGSIFDEKSDSKFVFSKFIYSCLIGRPLPVPSVIDSKNGINYIRCPTFNYHYEDFSLEVSNALSDLISCSGYRFMVYDIGNHFTKNSRDIIDASDIIVYYHSIKNPDGNFKLPFDKSHTLNVMMANYSDMDRYRYEGLYVPKCREGNFYGFDNEYGIEMSRIASVIGGLI